MSRRLEGISDRTWRLLLVGGGVAIWFLIALIDVAFANDCAEYVKKVGNLVGIPKGLMEDCMRTGYVQAITTAIISSIAGTAIAGGATKALTDAMKGWEPGIPGPPPPDYKEGQEGPPKDNPWDPSDADRRAKWEKDKVVWDPRELGWRRPRPDELPPPEKGPRRPGPSNDEIRKRWNEDGFVWDPDNNLWRKPKVDETGPPDYPPEGPPPYEKGNPRGQTPPACLGLYDEYVKTQARLLELEPEMDKAGADLRRAQDWLQLKLGLFTAQFAVDMTNFVQLGGALTRAAGPISQTIGKMGSIKQIAQAAARKAATLAKAVVELGTELAELGVKVVKLRSAATALKETANFLSKHADELAESVLAINKRVAQNRRLLKMAGELDGFVAKRGAIVKRLIEAEKRLAQGEAFWTRQRQLQSWAEGERASITAEQARLALSAQAELDAVLEEIRTLQARIAQSPEVANAAQRTAKATTTLNKLKARVMDLEARAKTIKIPYQKKQAFLAAESARDAASEAVDALDAEIRRLRDEMDKLAESPALQQLRAQETTAFTDFDNARNLHKARANEYMQAQGELGRVTRQVDDALEARKGIPPVTPAEKARIRDATADMNVKQTEMMKAQTARDQLDQVHDNAVEATGKQKTKNIARRDELGLSDQLAAATERKAALGKTLQDSQSVYDAAAKDLQPHSHPGLGNVDEFPDVEASLAAARADLESGAGPVAKQEFDDAYAAEAAVKTNLEAGAMPALEARKGAAQAKLKHANRSWQEVAAEKNPGNFQAWKLEVEGTDPFNEGAIALRPQQEEVLNLRKQEAELEKDINLKRDQAGPDDSAALERRIADDNDALTKKRAEADSAREQAKSKQAEAAQAERSAADVEAEQAKKQGQLERAKAQQNEADADVKRVEAGEPPLDRAAQGSLDAIDALTKRSKELSDQFKPAVAQSIENVVKSAAGAFGERWVKLFNGQSPDEVAEGIKKSRDKVIRLQGELASMTAEYDNARTALRNLKPRLDACIQQNTYWKGPSSEN